MSDTTGWDKWADGRYCKTIGNYHFECNRMSPGRWYLRAGGENVKPPRPTLRECQLLAQATARLWSGEQ